MYFLKRNVKFWIPFPGEDFLQNWNIFHYVSVSTQYFSIINILQKCFQPSLLQTLQHFSTERYFCYPCMSHPMCYLPPSARDTVVCTGWYMDIILFARKGSCIKTQRIQVYPWCWSPIQEHCIISKVPHKGLPAFLLEEGNNVPLTGIFQIKIISAKKTPYVNGSFSFIKMRLE